MRFGCWGTCSSVARQRAPLSARLPIARAFNDAARAPAVWRGCAQAARPLAEGEVALLVPLRLGLSMGSFRAARVAAQVVGAWDALPGSDQYLDALVLAYEASLHGQRSPWRDLVCLMPREYAGLLVHARCGGRGGGAAGKGTLRPALGAEVSGCGAEGRVRRRVRRVLLPARSGPEAEELLSPFPGLRAAATQRRCV
jgi:hypothetical protein